MSLNLFSVLFSALVSVSVMAEPIKTLSQVNLGEFAGTWYRIASNPIVFEPKCRCARQILTPNSDGRVAVLNTCIKAKGDNKRVDITGFAEPIDSSGAKLSVDFGFPWKGSYWIIAFDKNLGYAVVTDKWGYSLYIMSRSPDMSQDLYHQVVQQLKTNKIKVNRLAIQSQSACTY